MYNHIPNVVADTRYYGDTSKGTNCSVTIPGTYVYHSWGNYDIRLYVTDLSSDSSDVTYLFPSRVGGTYSAYVCDTLEYWGEVHATVDPVEYNENLISTSTRFFRTANAFQAYSSDIGDIEHTDTTLSFEGGVGLAMSYDSNTLTFTRSNNSIVGNYNETTRVLDFTPGAGISGAGGIFALNTSATESDTAYCRSVYRPQT